MFKIGLSTNEKLINEELFSCYANANITDMEISVSSDFYDLLDYSLIKSLAQKYNINLWSFHLPFSPFNKIDISSTDNNLRNSTISYQSELIKKAADIGISHFIIHPSGEPIETYERSNRLTIAKDSLNQLSIIAKSVGGVLAVENLPRSCLGKNYQEMLELIKDNSELGICFDTNHLLEGNQYDFIKEVGSKIISTHISDYDFVNERHWLPGEGKIDWQSVLKALNEVGYNGPWMYEIMFDCPKTIIRNRNLSCNDFRNNALEIFENNPISVFSTPKENLGMWE